MNREAWLEAATEHLRPYFQRQAGVEIPDTVRVSCGWPSRSATSANRRRIGECWSPTCAEDKRAQIFISPCLAESVPVLAVLVHELVHAAVGTECGHKGAFRRVAKAVNLVGKMTATSAGDGLKAVLGDVAAVLGPYPHAKLEGLARTKQATRMIKIKCHSCGWTGRTVRQWIDAGLPTCACGGQIVEVTS